MIYINIKLNKYIKVRWKNLNIIQIAKSIEKIFNAGFDDDKLILAMQLEDIQKIEGLTMQDINTIIKFKKAIRTKQIVKFLAGKEI